MALKQEEYRPLIQQIVDDINSKFIERDELARFLILFIFAKQHVFLIGKPGVGKTDIVSTISSVINGGSFWELVVNTETKTRHFFGDEDLPLEERDIKKTIMGHETVFFDEMFKAKDDTLNALLPFLNERKYQHNGESHPVKLISAVGASNELPSGEKIAPFVDRLIGWYEVVRIKDDENFIKFGRKQFVEDRTMSVNITLEDIDNVAIESHGIDASREFWEKFVEIKKEIIVAQLDVSDRKFGRIIDVLRASAYMNNRTSLDYSDIFLLKYMTWTKYSHKKDISRILNDFAFSNEDEIDSKMELGVEMLKALNGRISNEAAHFINHHFHMEHFTSELERKFERFIQIGAQEILIDIDTCYKQFISIKEKHDFSIYVTKQVEQNIFVVNERDNTFTENRVNLFTESIATLQNYKNRINDWLLENDDYFTFTRNCQIKREVAS